MRNMSFFLTTEQVLAQSKNVTRRLGWLHLKPGQQFQPVVKGMGLRAGEKVERLGGAVVTVSTRLEKLCRMIDEPAYGREECQREGFPKMSPDEFVAMFCASHRGCTPDGFVNRIEFSYKVIP